MHQLESLSKRQNDNFPFVLVFIALVLAAIICYQSC